MSKAPITLAEDRDPWDRQPSESVRQYSRFRVYLELGRTRTLKSAAETLNALGDSIAATALYQYAWTYRWTERAELSDHESERLDRERLIAARRDMVERHRRIATAMTAAAVRELQVINNLPAGNMTVSDVVRLVRLSVDIERAAIGDPQRIVALTGPTGGPVEVADLSHYTADERAARLAEISRELARRAGLGDDADD